jgi:lysine-specific demethylase 3
MFQAKFVFLQYGAETVRGKSSKNGEVKQTGKKRKKGDAQEVSVTKMSKREDGEQKKASSSKDNDCGEKDRVKYSFLGISCLWNVFFLTSI